MSRRHEVICGAVVLGLATSCLWTAAIASPAGAAAVPRIAFVEGTSTTTIWTMAPNGRDLRQLTKGHRYDRAPAWSHDRHTIAFLRSASARSYAGQVWLMRSDGTHQQRLAYRGHSLASGTTALAYSPNGRLLAGGCQLASGWAVTVLDLKTHRSHIVARYQCQNGTTSLTWSPDSSQLIATIEYGGAYGMLRIDVVHSRLMKDYGVTMTESASWRSDGKYLLCSVWAPEDPGYPFYAYLMKLDGTKVRKLGKNQRFPVYSPNCRLYAFLVYTASSTKLERANANGSGVTRILTRKGQGCLWDVAWK